MWWAGSWLTDGHNSADTGAVTRFVMLCSAGTAAVFLRFQASTSSKAAMPVSHSQLSVVGLNGLLLAVQLVLFFAGVQHCGVLRATLLSACPLWLLPPPGSASGRVWTQLLGMTTRGSHASSSSGNTGANGAGLAKDGAGSLRRGLLLSVASVLVLLLATTQDPIAIHAAPLLLAPAPTDVAPSPSASSGVLQWLGLGSGAPPQHPPLSLLHGHRPDADHAVSAALAHAVNARPASLSHPATPPSSQAVAAAVAAVAGVVAAAKPSTAVPRVPTAPPAPDVGAPWWGCLCVVLAGAIEAYRLAYIRRFYREFVGPKRLHALSSLVTAGLCAVWLLLMGLGVWPRGSRSFSLSFFLFVTRDFVLLWRMFCSPLILQLFPPPTVASTSSSLSFPVAALAAISSTVGTGVVTALAYFVFVVALGVGPLALEPVAQRLDRPVAARLGLLVPALTALLLDVWRGSQGLVVPAPEAAPWSRWWLVLVIAVMYYGMQDAAPVSDIHPLPAHILLSQL